MRLKKAAALTGLVLVSTMLSLFLADGPARVLSPFPEKHDKLWMLGSPTFQTDHGGAVRYMPNQTVRSVILQDGDIVYDLRFPTNSSVTLLASMVMTLVRVSVGGSKVIHPQIAGPYAVIDILRESSAVIPIKEIVDNVHRGRTHIA